MQVIAVLGSLAFVASIPAIGYYAEITRNRYMEELNNGE